MASSEPLDFERITALINGGEAPRVWSLIVTIFGDLAQEEGAGLSGAVLRHLTERIGIKPEAMRVALHRLKKDGWIDSQRNGRSRDYFLSDWGRAQSIAASPRIYTFVPRVTEAWAVTVEAGLANDRSHVWITPQLYVTTDQPTDSNAFAARLDASSRLPDWMRNRMLAPELAEMSKRLSLGLKAATDERLLGQSADLLDRTALRVLIVHSWRRIALKAPALPDFLWPMGCYLPECRAEVAAILNALEKPTLTRLHEAVEQQTA